MSTTDAAESKPVRSDARPNPEPRPLRTPGDAEGWRVVGRGRGKGKAVRVGVEVLFDDDQSAWLRAEADRRGIGYAELVKRLIDEARARGAA